MICLGLDLPLSGLKALPTGCKGAVLLDKALRRCRLWNDTRGHALAAKRDADRAFRRSSETNGTPP